jgi:hypothetical protein
MIVADRAVCTDLAFEDFALRSALDLWRTKCAGRVMPARGDFSHQDFMPFMGDITLIDVEYDPLRFRFRLIGTNIVQTVMRDMTGSYLDDIYPPNSYENVVRSFQYILEHRRPVRGTGNVSHAEKEYLRVEVLDAPLSSDSETIDMIIKFVAWTN